MASRSRIASARTTASTGSDAGVVIRRFLPADAGAVVALVRGIFAQEFPEDQAAYPLEDLERLEAAYGGPRETLLVAQVAGRIVGTCGVKEDGPTTALLRRLFVEQTARGRGIGAALVQRAIAHCRGQGFREVRIRTSDRMRTAIAVCQRQGFHEHHRDRFGAIQLVQMTREL